MTKEKRMAKVATLSHEIREHMRMARFWAAEARRCRAMGNDEGFAMSLTIAKVDRQAASERRAIRAKLIAA